MFKQLVSFAKKHWVAILAVITLLIIGIFTLGNNKESMHDYELAGCSTCSMGDAGVLLDTETEMYYMPDDYYSNDENIQEADDDQMVLMNPDETAAVVTDREATNVPVVYYSESEYANTTFADNVAAGLQEDVIYDDSEEDVVDDYSEEDSEDDVVYDDSEEDVVYDDSELDAVNLEDQVEEEENEDQPVSDEADELQMIPLDESYETEFTEL